MPRTANGLKRFYGSNPLHLLALLGSFALVGYIIAVVGPKTLWDSRVWWQSILVWFVGSIVAHDLVLFPLYAIADRSLAAGCRAVTGRFQPSRAKVSPVNYIRAPVLGTGLLFLLFFPGIIRQGKDSYLVATGQTQQPFLDRWLLITAVMFGASAIAYAIRSGLARDTVIDNTGAPAIEAKHNVGKETPT
ncbi:MAG: hypothetical protein ACRDWB_06845 [Acidimicrobiales bacterium]